MLHAFGVRSSRDKSLLAWGRKFFPEYFWRAPGKHHIDLDEKLREWSRERGVRVTVEGPRGCAKSTVLTFLFPLWCICHNIEDYIILFAETYEQAMKYLKEIRSELETNEKLAKSYPNACGRGSEWNNDGILTRNGVRVEALGSGQAVRGRKKGAARPSLMVMDDVEGDDAAYSSKMRDHTRDWATSGVMKAGRPGTNIILAGTVIHRECLVAHCGRRPGWKRLPYKSIIQWPNRMDLWGKWEQVLIGTPGEQEKADQEALAFYNDNEEEMKLGSKILWPELEDLYALMFMRAAEGHTSFESEKQNNPIDPSKCEWDPQLFEGEDLWFDDWPEDPQCVVMALDPSKGKTDKPGDFQAIVSLMVGSDGLLYVDADIGRHGLGGMMDRFVNISRDIRPDVAVVEEDTFQELLIPEIEERARKQAILVPVEGISTGGVPKMMRIRRLGPYVSRRRIKYRKRSEGATLLRQQMMDVPTGDKVDGPDALEMAVRAASGLLADQEDAGVSDPR